MAKNQKKKTIASKNISKLIYYQILANTLILNLKYNENIILSPPIDILLMVINSAIFVWHPGSYTNLNTTCVNVDPLHFQEGLYQTV